MNLNWGISDWSIVGIPVKDSNGNRLGARNHQAVFKRKYYVTGNWMSESVDNQALVLWRQTVGPIITRYTKV